MKGYQLVGLRLSKLYDFTPDPISNAKVTKECYKVIAMVKEFLAETYLQLLTKNI